jgi:hypothetical protein
LVLVVLEGRTLLERLRTVQILFLVHLQQLAVAVALTSQPAAERVETALLVGLAAVEQLIRLLAQVLGQEGLELRVKVTLAVRLPVPLTTQVEEGAVLEQLDQTQPARLAGPVAMALTLIQRGLLQLQVAQADTTLAAAAAGILPVVLVVLVVLVVAVEALMALLELLELQILAAAVDRDVTFQLVTSSTAGPAVLEL